MPTYPSAPTLKAIHKAHHPEAPWGAAHPLDGLTVAEWVAAARKGPKRVPRPGNPFAAARKVTDKWGSYVDFEWTDDD